MPKRHQFYVAELAGRAGARFLTDFLRETTGSGPRPAVTVKALPEYGFISAEKPPANKTNTMRLDLLFVILGQEDRVTVGFEVKVDKNDLLFGEKLHYELGITDYLFLAVPRMLIPCARYVIKDQLPEDVKRIGLVDLTEGDIVIFPNRASNEQGVLTINPDPDLRHFTSVDMTDYQRLPRHHFHSDGELMVNNRYTGLLARPYKPSLPRRSERFERFQISHRYRGLLREEKGGKPPMPGKILY